MNNENYYMEKIAKLEDKNDRLLRLTHGVLAELANAGLMAKFQGMFQTYSDISNEGK